MLDLRSCALPALAAAAQAGNDVEVGDWFDEFVKSNPRIGANAADQCLVLAHHPPSSQHALRHASKVPAKVRSRRPALRLETKKEGRCRPPPRRSSSHLLPPFILLLRSRWQG